MKDRISFDQLLEEIKAQRHFWIRLGAVLIDDTWVIQIFDAVGGSQQQNWEKRSWEYPEAIFSSLSINGSKLAEAIREGIINSGEKRIKFPFSESLDKKQDNLIQTIEVWSKIPHGFYEPLDWPCVWYELPRTSDTTTKDYYQGIQHLVMSECPSFLNFKAAACSFFNLTKENNITELPTTIRLEGQIGRIDHVTVHPTRIVAKVERKVSTELVLELNGNRPGPSQLFKNKGKSEVIKLSIASGLPDDPFLILKDNKKIIDLRYLNPKLPYKTAPDVVVAVPTTSAIESLIATGESETVEFKEFIPTGKNERKKVCRILAAFANGQGGNLLFGVNDDGKPVGLKATDDKEKPVLEKINESKLKDQVADWIKSCITPYIKFDIEIARLEGNYDILLIKVKKGDSPPYGIPYNDEKDCKYDYCIRRMATTFTATPSDIREICLMQNK